MRDRILARAEAINRGSDTVSKRFTSIILYKVHEVGVNLLFSSRLPIGEGQIWTEHGTE